MSGTLPPLQELTSDNRGPIVVVVAYIFLTLTIVFTTIRIVTFHTLKRGFGLDDAYLLVAAVKNSDSLLKTTGECYQLIYLLGVAAGIGANYSGSASC